MDRSWAFSLHILISVSPFTLSQGIEEVNLKGNENDKSEHNRSDKEQNSKPTFQLRKVY
jgi:hypothetical protein